MAVAVAVAMRASVAAAAAVVVVVAVAVAVVQEHPLHRLAAPLSPVSNRYTVGYKLTI
jgi:hypothetical protein